MFLLLTRYHYWSDNIIHGYHFVGRIPLGNPMKTFVLLHLSRCRKVQKLQWNLERFGWDFSAARQIDRYLW